MKRSNDERIALRGCVTRILFVFVLVALGAQAWRTCYGVSGAPRGSNIKTETLPESIAKEIGSQARLRNFTLSLEVKENTDFLLTPALLVQEALREDVIITYPTE